MLRIAISFFILPRRPSKSWVWESLRSNKAASKADYVSIAPDGIPQ